MVLTISLSRLCIPSDLSIPSYFPDTATTPDPPLTPPRGEGHLSVRDLLIDSIVQLELGKGLGLRYARGEDHVPPSRQQLPVAHRSVSLNFAG
jgi:hypothetical protein